MSTPRPRIVLLSTGGTIAGTAASATDLRSYSAARLAADELAKAVPALAEIADIAPQTLFELDSKDMRPEHWLVLLRRLRVLLADPMTNGVVITHGTDTLEETAYFLQITLPTSKPVVLTAAMRPATALSADGPMNLYQAVALASRPAAARAGVLAVLGDRIHSASTLSKRHPCAVDAFSSMQALTTQASDFALHALAPDRHSRISLPEDLEVLPPVELLTVAAGSSPALATATARALKRARAAVGSAGLVLALPGNASLPRCWEDALAELSQSIPVVLASRCGAGVDLGGSTRPPNWLACGTLDALKARVRLIAGLAGGRRGVRLKRWFERA